MYLLGISGSPKKTGLASLLLDNALAGAKASGALTEKIVLNDLDFKPCQECGGCDETGVCVLDDEMRPVYEKLAKADAVVLASPIYFGNITAQLKGMIDRCHSSWVAKEKLGHPSLRDVSLMRPVPLGPDPMKRKGIFLCVAGRESEEYFESAKKIINIFFVTQNIEYLSGLFVSGLDTMPADSPKREVALKKAFQLGVDLVS